MPQLIVGASFICAAFYSHIALPDVQEDGGPVAVQETCDAEEYDAHRFRVGKWKAISPDTGEEVGIQEVRRILNGCAYEVSWQQLNDQFRKPGSKHRYAAHGIIALKNGIWTQAIVDNGGGVFITNGGLDDRGVYFDSAPTKQGVTYRTYISRDENGVLWNEAYGRESGDSDWESLWRFRYQRIEGDNEQEQ